MLLCMDMRWLEVLLLLPLPFLWCSFLLWTLRQDVQSSTADWICHDFSQWENSYQAHLDQHFPIRKTHCISPSEAVCSQSKGGLQMVLPLSSDCFADAGASSGSRTLADVAELSPSGEVAHPSGKGCGENHRASRRLSPLAHNWPNQRLPNWNPAEGLKGGETPARRACPGTGAQQNSSGRSLTWVQHTGPGISTWFLSLFKPNPFFHHPVYFTGMFPLGENCSAIISKQRFVSKPGNVTNGL